MILQNINWDIDNMRNSTFFKEAMIVANYAMKCSDPLNKGIDYGIKQLKIKRGNKTEEFSEDIFNAYADYYRKVAKQLITVYAEYKSDSERFKALKLSRV